MDQLQAIVLALEKELDNYQPFLHIFTDSWAIDNGLAICYSQQQQQFFIQGFLQQEFLASLIPKI